MAEPPVAAALDALADAATPQALIAAHQQMRRAVRASRRKAALGRLAQTYTEAMDLWDHLKANGAALEERVRGLEAVLRDAWPFTREWKYVCSTCDDHGLEMKTCDGGATCGRTTPHAPHTFGVPCWCDAGARFRRKPAPTPDDFTAAGKSKPTRVGRR